MKRLFKVTLTQGFNSEQIKLKLLVWAKSKKEVHDKLINLVQANTDVEVDVLKWWQWK